MFEVLNVLVSLIVVLFQIIESRNELNQHGDDWIRFLNHTKRTARKSEKK